METSEALHWTRQQQQKIDMDPEQQPYIPKIDITTAVIKIMSKLFTFLRIDYDIFSTIVHPSYILDVFLSYEFFIPILNLTNGMLQGDFWNCINDTIQVHVVQAMIIMVGRSRQLLLLKKCPMRESNPGRSGRKPNGSTSLPPTPVVTVNAPNVYTSRNQINFCIYQDDTQNHEAFYVLVVVDYGTIYHSTRLFGGTTTTIGTLQRRLVWTLRKDDTQNREAFYVLVVVDYGTIYHSTRLFGSTYITIGTIQRILVWPLRKDDMQNREAFHKKWLFPFLRIDYDIFSTVVHPSYILDVFLPYEFSIPILNLTNGMLQGDFWNCINDTIQEEQAHDANIWACAWRKNEKDETDYIVTGSIDDIVKSWKWNGQSLELKHIFEGHSLGVFDTDINKDGTIASSCSLDSIINLWNLETGENILKIQPGPVDAWGAKFSPDSKTIASGSNMGKINLFNVENGKTELTLDTKGKFTLSISFSPDGKYLASGAIDGIIKIFDIATGKLVQTLEGHAMPIRSLMFSKDSQFLITASDDCHIKIYDVQQGNLVCTLSGHSSWVLTLDVSPDGKHFVSGSSDKSVKLWDLNTRECIHTFTEHSDQVWSTKFNSDGSKIVSVSDDKSILIYELQF
ncbi:WDR61 [Cordylochernes scorpioides]|uniref:WDR61 n=1 Tax=Cordylochernes scorpioides TaxID=51811 RepID=A0ABY6L1P3_9ARAC|nr:WDR61 [Cordylochernes scorpioides]